MNISSVKNGNWFDTETWDFGIPNNYDTIYIDHDVVYDQEYNKIIDLCILKNGILHMYNNFYSINIKLMGGTILNHNNSLIYTNSILSENYMDENNIFLNGNI